MAFQRAFEIDLRSDTVPKPDASMRAAMADAEVAADVLDHDPTMRRLEEEVADLLGCAAALWVPSGSMGNAIALMLHLRRGDRYLAPEHAHVIGSELGTAAWLAQGMPDPLSVTATKIYSPSCSSDRSSAGTDCRLPVTIFSMPPDGIASRPLIARLRIIISS